MVFDDYFWTVVTVARCEDGRGGYESVGCEVDGLGKMSEACCVWTTASMCYGPDDTEMSSVAEDTCAGLEAVYEV